MTRFLTCLVLLTATLPVLAQDILPRDVQRFVDRREGCDHMRGEYPDPSERQGMKEVHRELNKLCTGTDKELIQLKRKYTSNSTIMQVLNQFESGIEASTPPVMTAKAGQRGS